jgi:1-acyl-sn-glycerol-3-phosphate acyltransferase
MGSIEIVERRVLGLVSALVAELGTGSGRRPGLDDSLERDLGIGSLERVELMLRLERTFGVAVGDAVMAEADTSRELVRAVLAGAPATVEVETLPAAPVAPGAAVPGSVGTLVEALRWHVDTAPERLHLVLRREDGQEIPITYGTLWSKAASVASALGEYGIQPGETVSVMLPTGESFFPVFFGILLAGAVPVPIYPPVRRDRLTEYVERQLGILSNAGAALLVTFSEAERVAGLLRPRVASLRGVIAADHLVGGPELVATPRFDPTAPALIQYTSGSTGDPKGVLLSHANLLANIRALGQAVDLRPDDVCVSWLPLYHDMGLIGCWLGALYHGIPAVIMSPLAFLSRPSRWLRALHRHRGTLSAAPNFAFDLCVKKIPDEEIAGLDLSGWRLAMNGSEAVSAETIERFSHRFAPYGFRPEAMCPVYGLAECSVGLTVSPPGRGPRVDTLAREVFERDRRAVHSRPGEPALEFVSCGRPLPGHPVRIVDAHGVPVGERIEGRVHFRGPSVTSGYFRNPDATTAALHDGWMDSGDLGYLANGELYITGRQKDIIIKAGRNLYPQTIEDLVGTLPGIRQGCVAAFGVNDPAIGTERLVVVAETHDPTPAGRDALRAAVAGRVVDALGVPPDTVVITSPGTVAKTSSGKIRRGATRSAYLGGTLGRRRRGVVAQWVGLVGADVEARLRQLPTSVLRRAFAAWVGLLLVATMPVLWILVRLLPTPGAVERAARGWCRLVLVGAGFRPRVEGLERIPEAGGAVLAANHSSYLDVVALMAMLPPGVRFVAKKELRATPLVGTVIGRLGHTTVDRANFARGVEDTARVTQVLRDGTRLCIFPEGTFRRSPALLPFRLGAFQAAVDARVPVVPVVILGTRQILPAGTCLPRPGRISVTIGAPVNPEGAGWREVVRIRDRVRGEIARRLDGGSAPPV